MVIALYDSTYIVSGSEDCTIRVWNLAKKTKESLLKGHSASVNRLCVLKNGKIISGSSDITVRIWDIDTIDENNTIYTSSCEISNIFEIYISYVYIEFQNTNAIVLKMKEKNIFASINNHNNIKFTSFAGRNGIYLNSGLAIAYMRIFFEDSKIKIQKNYDLNFGSMINEPKELKDIISSIQIVNKKV